MRGGQSSYGRGGLGLNKREPGGGCAMYAMYVMMYVVIWRPFFAEARGHSRE